MSPFEEGPSELRCHDCQAPIDLARYRRKVSRCDICEATALAADHQAPGFTQRLNAWLKGER